MAAEEEERKRRRRQKPFTLKPTTKKPTSTAYQFGDLSAKKAGVPVPTREPLEEAGPERNLKSASETRPRNRGISTEPMGANPAAAGGTAGLGALERPGTGDANPARGRTLAAQ